MGVGEETKADGRFPKRTPLDLEATVREYSLERVSRHKRDSYAGVRLAKLPEDLRVYEHLMWASKPNTVIEIGTLDGGSALWFRDRLRTLATYTAIGQPLVISVDVDVRGAREVLSGRRSLVRGEHQAGRG